ncbi:MAG: hypothetical protein OHK0053_03110 [Microscillaceae bacterium]
MSTSTLAQKRKKQARVLRWFRKVHRTTGIFLFAFFFIVSLTGLLLGWKKHSFGLILPASQKGTSTRLQDWLPLDQLKQKAAQALHEQVSPRLSLDLDRIDVRPEKGMAKFVYQAHYYEVQLDGATGKVLQISLRRSDIIENIHDGSIIDFYFQIPYGGFKLFYTSVMGLALLLFTITGFWLWVGPRRMRQLRSGEA